MKTYSLRKDESDHIAVVILLVFVFIGLVIWLLPSIIEWAVRLGVVAGEKL